MDVETTLCAGWLSFLVKCCKFDYSNNSKITLACSQETFLFYYERLIKLALVIVPIIARGVGENVTNYHCENLSNLLDLIERGHDGCV